MGDKLMWYKYIVKNVARRNGKTATFMPKPIFGDNGTGMHTHQSIWKGEKPLFAGDGYAGMSEMAMHYIARHPQARAGARGVHQPDARTATAAWCRASRRRSTWRTRAATARPPIRIPMYSPSPKAKRIEVRFPDPACNGYLAFAAMLMAGLDGIERQLDPGEPLDKDIYSLTPEELKDVPTMPGSLDEALDNLQARITTSCSRATSSPRTSIETWIEYKMANEVDAMRLRPHPYEFALYYDA